MVFTITVNGLPQTISSFNQFPNKYRTNRQNAHRQIAANGVNTLKKEAHVQTGKMKNAIKQGKVDPNTVEIISPMGYSGHENKRGGAHAFFDKSMKTITADAKKWEMSAVNQSLGR